MSRRRTQIGGQFAARLIEMLESPAYRALSLSARRLLDRIEIELGHHGGADNGELPVTYADFQDYGIDRDAIAPAIRVAVALGFVKCKHGRAGNAEYRTPNMFGLTYKPIKGLPSHGTNEWRKIGTLEEAELIAKMARNAVSPKTKSRSGKIGILGRENPDRKRRFHTPETPTTCHTPETPTTLDISGWGSEAAEPDPVVDRRPAALGRTGTK